MLLRQNLLFLDGKALNLNTSQVVRPHVMHDIVGYMTIDDIVDLTFLFLKGNSYKEMNSKPIQIEENKKKLTNQCTP